MAYKLKKHSGAAKRFKRNLSTVKQNRVAGDARFGRGGLPWG